MFTENERECHTKALPNLNHSATHGDHATAFHIAAVLGDTPIAISWPFFFFFLLENDCLFM